LDFWNPKNIPSAEKKDAYLFFGRLSPEKGLRTLLEAQSLWEKEFESRLCPEPPLQLLIAGSGPCEGNVKAKVAQLKLQSVSILGALGIDDLRTALGRSRFSILPSEWYENGPMAALESLAAGIPLVGTDIGGIPEMIVPGKNGLVVPVKNQEGLLAGLRKGAEFGQDTEIQARVWAEKFASRKEHMAKLENILLSVVEK